MLSGSEVVQRMHTANLQLKEALSTWEWLGSFENG